MIGLMRLLNIISNKVEKVENRAREFYWTCGLVNYKYQEY